MAKHTITISGNTDTQICKIKKPRASDNWCGTIMIYGGGGNNFGSGTVTLKISPDQGTTKITTKDSAGTNVTATSNACFVIPVSGAGDSNDDYLSLYASMSGSTSPTVIVEVWDNL